MTWLAAVLFRVYIMTDYEIQQKLSPPPPSPGQHIQLEFRSAFSYFFLVHPLQLIPSVVMVFNLIRLGGVGV